MRSDYKVSPGEAGWAIILSFVSTDPCKVCSFNLSLYELLRHDLDSGSLPKEDSCIRFDDSSATLVNSLHVAREVLLTDLECL